MCSEAAATSSSARVDMAVLRRGLEAVEHQVRCDRPTHTVYTSLMVHMCR